MVSKSLHHYQSAVILYDAKHYTDTIAVDLHYAVEIILKSFLVNNNQKIVKTHDLIELVSLLKANLEFDEDELSLLDVITRYHIQESYPSFDRALPSRIEIKEAMKFTQALFLNACKIINIPEESIINE